ncbi:MAG: VCBS domain-containing protein, partial [Gammaproteobacteria bacterium]
GTDGTWTYALDNANATVQALGAGQTLTETFTVSSIDGTSSTVTVTINGTNDAAVISSGTGSVTEDSVLFTSGTLTITDADSGQASFVAQPSTSGAYGTFSLGTDGTWTYALDNANATVQALGAGQTLTETFTVTSLDGTTSSVTVTINGTNDAPSFAISAQTASVSEEGLSYGVPDSSGAPTDTTNAVAATGTFAVTDIDGPTVTLTLTAPTVDLTSNGVPVTWNGNGTSTLTANAGSAPIMTIGITNTGAYTVTLHGAIDHPTANLEDIVSFGVIVTASDGITNSTGLLTVKVEDDSPVANGDFVTLTTGSSTTGNVLANDLSGADQPGQVVSVVHEGVTYTATDGTFMINTGEGVLTMGVDGAYSYQSLLYTAAGGTDGLASWSNVSLAAFNGARTVVSENEFFIDPVTYVPIAQNILALTATGVVTVIDSAMADGTDGLGVAGGSGSATYINGHPSSPEAIMVNLGHEATSLNATFYSGTASGVPFYWAAYDASGDLIGIGNGPVTKPGFALHVEDAAGTPFQYVVFYGVDTSASSKILLLGLDSIEFAPPIGDEFAYHLIDADGDPSSARLAISQTSPSNTAPVAAHDNYTTLEDTAITLDVLANDADADGDTFALWGHTQATNGVVSTDASGNLVYTPNVDWSGTDSFTYTIRDSNGGISTATATVQVAPVADTPTLEPVSSLYLLNPGSTVITTGSTDSVTSVTGTGVSQANLELELALPAGYLDNRFDPTGVNVNDPGFVNVIDGKATQALYAMTPGMTVTWNYAFTNGENLQSEVAGGYNDLVVLLVTDPAGNKQSILVDSSEEKFPSLTSNDSFTFTATMAGTYTFSWLVLNGGDANKDSSLSLLNTTFGVGGDAALYGTPVVLPPLATSLGDQDGSEILTVRIAGLPIGARFTTGTDHGDGSWSFAASELSTLTLLPPANYTGTLDLMVTATATETANGATASTSQPLSITIDQTTTTYTSSTQSSQSLTGTTGNDLIRAYAGDDTINAGDGNDLAYGGAGNDTLNGGNGNDWLFGGVGNDVLDGGAGNDTLLGGAGNDILTGGLGADVFKWTLTDRGSAGAPALDTITDFDNVDNSDKLDLRDLLVGESHAGTDPGNLASYLHFETSGTATVIQISTAGGFSGGYNAGATDQQITLNGIDLTAGGTLSSDQIIQDLFARGKLITD